MEKLAYWKCHKIVKAGKILILPDDGPVTVTVEDSNGTPCQIKLSQTTFARGRPVVGDYIVVYEDGYISWSPARVFEEGYTKQDKQ